MKVLIVNSNELNHDNLKELLVKDDENLVIKQAFSYKDALRIFPVFSPDKVFLDLALYELGILKLLKMFKVVNPSVKVIFMVSSPAHQFKETCLKMGAHDFFDKSILKG